MIYDPPHFLSTPSAHYVIEDPAMTAAQGIAMTCDTRSPLDSPGENIFVVKITKYFSLLAGRGQ